MDNMPIPVDHKVAIRSLKNLKVVGDIVVRGSHDQL